MTRDDPIAEPKQKSPLATCLLAAALSAAVLVAVAVLLAMLSFILLPVLMELTGAGAAEHPAVGKRLAALQLVPLVGDAEPVTLDDLAGKVVLVNFWGTWCPPCRVELPHIVEMQRKYADRDDFRLLAVSCGSGGQEDLIRLRNDTEDFLNRQGVAMPIYADPGGTTRTAAARLDAFSGYPGTILLDRAGTIRGVWVGYSPGVEQQVEQLVNQLLAEQ